MSVESAAMRWKLPFAIKKDAVIVLEGLDATGKSTQHEKMERACIGMGHGKAPLFDPAPLFLHMPSAGTDLGHMIYDLTESVGSELDPLARQFLHLASHAQSVQQAIKPALKGPEPRPVVLDRWWWSTIAYGWFGSKMGSRMSLDTFEEVVRRTWAGVKADVVFLFLHPHKEDRHNTTSVTDGYEYLADKFSDRVVFIGPGDEGEQGEQMYEAMARRGLYRNEG
jgi:dTMP kinase